MADTEIRLLVAVASGRGWAAKFGHSYGRMLLRIGMDMIPGSNGRPRVAKIALQVNSQAYLVIARQRHMDRAIKENFTHLLSLDDDMTFPADLVHRMIAHDKAVVTCNYRKKKPDVIETVCVDLKGRQVVSTNKSGIERISSMGMGTTLIDIEKVRHVPAPHFAVLYNEGTEEFVIEDGVFSALLQTHGVEMWCDHDLSQEVGHIGEFEYKTPTIDSFAMSTPLERVHEKAQATH